MKKQEEKGNKQVQPMPIKRSIKVNSENELRLKEALRQSCLNHAAKLAEIVNVYPA